ncbi:MAG: hypothetical protein ACTSPX_03795 [Candidatus Thorarchaeota archaeon]
MSLQEFVSQHKRLTDLQKEDWLANLPGKTVDWAGTVLEVKTDGTVIVDIPGTLASSVALEGLPIETAKTIDKNRYIRFTGTIDDIIDFLGLHIYLVDVHITE